MPEASSFFTYRPVYDTSQINLGSYLDYHTLQALSLTSKEMARVYIQAKIQRLERAIKEKNWNMSLEMLTQNPDLLNQIDARSSRHLKKYLQSNGLENKTPLHLVLYHIQRDIAATGKCSERKLAIARYMLSLDLVDLHQQDNTATSCAKIILGQNTHRHIYMPPIVSLLNHPEVVKNTTELDRAVEVVSTSKNMIALDRLSILGSLVYKSALLVAAIAAVAAIIGAIGWTGGSIYLILLAFVGIIKFGAAIGSVLELLPPASMINQARENIISAENRRETHISSYHNPFVLTHKNTVRLKNAAKAIWQGVKAVGRAIALPFRYLSRVIAPLFTPRAATTPDIELTELPVKNSTAIVLEEIKPASLIEPRVDTALSEPLPQSVPISASAEDIIEYVPEDISVARGINNRM